MRFQAGPHRLCRGPVDGERTDRIGACRDQTIYRPRPLGRDQPFAQIAQDALGDPAELSLRAALDYIAGRSCTPIGTSASAARSTQLFAPANRPLTVPHPNAAQRDQPGLF